MSVIIPAGAAAIFFIAGWFAYSYIVGNIKAKKKLAAQKDEVCAQLTQASRMACVGELAAGLSHEVGNLLQIILGNTELMMQNGSGEYLVTIKESALAAKKILSNLMDFAVRQKLNFASQNIRETLESTLKIYGRQLEIKNIKVIKEYDADIPDLRVSEGALQQVFLNAILNAQKAMPDGGKLYITIVRDDPWVSIVFKDTGVGIKKENLSELFKPFFTTWPDGHGLGLGVSNDIVKRHGGQMNVRSEGEGKGAAIEIKLPLVFEEQKT